MPLTCSHPILHTMCKQITLIEHSKILWQDKKLPNWQNHSLPYNSPKAIIMSLKECLILQIRMGEGGF